MRLYSFNKQSWEDKSGRIKGVNKGREVRNVRSISSERMSGRRGRSGKWWDADLKGWYIKEWAHYPSC